MNEPAELYLHVAKPTEMVDLLLTLRVRCTLR